MTDPTARDLIQRLADPRELLQQLRDGINRHVVRVEEPKEFEELLTAIDSYFATPEPAADGPAVPEGREPASVVYEPSDAELNTLWQELYRFHDGATSGEVAEIARAVLARWGRQSPAPIPLSERQPTEADCDVEDQCWFWHPDHKEDDFTDGWMLLKPEWAEGCHDSDDSPAHTHWLPHWALPVPKPEASQ